MLGTCALVTLSWRFFQKIVSISFDVCTDNTNSHKRSKTANNRWMTIPVNIIIISLFRFKFTIWFKLDQLIPNTYNALAWEWFHIGGRRILCNSMRNLYNIRCITWYFIHPVFTMEKSFFAIQMWCITLYNVVHTYCTQLAQFILLHRHLINNSCLSSRCGYECVRI